MLNKNVIEEGLAQCIKDIAGCQTHLANYDYTGIKLKYPRIVVDVQMPQFFAIQSQDQKVVKETETTGRRTITQQFELDVVITSVGSPQDNLAYEKLQQIRGKMHADYDLLFPMYKIQGLFVNAFSEIEDMSVELKTKIEDRYRMTMTLTGSTEIYNDVIAKIVEVNPQISYEK
jgi:hypothetical protein